MDELIEEAIKLERNKWIRYIKILLEKNLSKENMQYCLRNLIDMEEE